MNRSTKHALAAFLTVALVCCSSWGQPASLSRDLLEKRPSRLQVTLTDGRRLDVVRPRARGDTLFGDTLIYRGEWATRSPVAIPLADVRSVSPRRFSAVRTAALAVGVTAVVGAIVAVAVSNSIMSGGLGGGAGCAGPKETWPE